MSVCYIKMYEDTMVIATPFREDPKAFYYNQKILGMKAQGTLRCNGRDYGFGDTAKASENMIFHQGRAHKLDRVHFHIPSLPEGSPDFLKPWTFTSNDGRFEALFTPILDRASRTRLAVLESDQHQVFGSFTGKALLDDQQVVEFRDFPGFAEKVYNKW